MGASWIKTVTESNLTGLHGPIHNVDINKFTELEDGYEIEGVYRQSFGGEYSFSMKIDSKGNVKSYKRTKNDEFGRNVRVSNVY